MSMSRGRIKETLVSWQGTPPENKNTCGVEILGRREPDSAQQTGSQHCGLQIVDDPRDCSRDLNCITKVAQHAEGAASVLP